MALQPEPAGVAHLVRDVVALGPRIPRSGGAVAVALALLIGAACGQVAPTPPPGTDSPVAIASVAATPATSTPSLPPTPLVPNCGRLGSKVCAEVIGLVRDLSPRSVGDAGFIVADSTCPPGAWCSWADQAIVVLGPANWTGTDQLNAFAVGGEPEHAAAWTGDFLPAHVQTLVAPSDCLGELRPALCRSAEYAALAKVVAERWTATHVWVKGGVFACGVTSLFDPVIRFCGFPAPPEGGRWVATVEVAFAQKQEHAGLNIANVGGRFVAKLIGYRVPLPGWCSGSCP